MYAALPQLDEDDWALFRERGAQHRFETGQVILEEGSRRNSIYLIDAGSVRVVRAHHGRGVVLRTLRKGELFGEMSFLRDSGASATIIAEEPVSVLQIPEDVLNEMLTSKPDLAARFYRAVAEVLADRLVAANAVLPSVLADELPQYTLHKTYLTRVTGDDRLPSSLVDEVQGFKDTMIAADRALKDGADSEEVAKDVSAACEGLKNALFRHIDRDAVNAREMGAFVFRETFPYFMSSRLLDHAFAKPRGYAGDFDVLEQIYDNRPTGAGRLGPIIDAWALNTSHSRAVRARRELIVPVISAAMETWKSGDPMPLAALGSGPARELFDMFKDVDSERLLAFLLDIDEEALNYVQKRAEEMGVAHRLVLAMDNIVRLVQGRGQIGMLPQHMIYSLSLLDYLQDWLAVALINWTYDNLLPGGVAAFGCMSEVSSDRAFMDHVSQWPLIYRSPDDVKRLFGQTKFAGQDLTVSRDATGGQLLAVCGRPG